MGIEAKISEPRLTGQGCKTPGGLVLDSRSENLVDTGIENPPSQ